MLSVPSKPWPEPQDACQASAYALAFRPGLTSLQICSKVLAACRWRCGALSLFPSDLNGRTSGLSVSGPGAVGGAIGGKAATAGRPPGLPGKFARKLFRRSQDGAAGKSGARPKISRQGAKIAKQTKKFFLAPGREITFS
jgi:hypothetical protein